jgi:hypothetical protein
MSKPCVEFCTFQSAQGKAFSRELKQAGLKRDRVCLGVVEGLIALASGPLMAVKNPMGRNSSPVHAMGTIIVMGLARFDVPSQSYSLTPAGVEYHEQLHAKGLTESALRCRERINQFAKEVAA